MTKRKNPEDKKKVGRPSKFDPNICEQTTKLCMLGATDKELADFFHVTESTLNLWKTQHPEFSEALKQGKDIADATVASKLYKRATGYEHEDTHFSAYEGDVTQTKYTKVYPPDTTACIFWLKNRRRQDWRDVDTRGMTVAPLDLTDLVEAARRLAFMVVLGEEAAKKLNEQTPARLN